MTRPRLAALLTSLLLAGCAGTADDGAPAVPDRAPDVTGVVGAGERAGDPVLVEASDAYYEGMGLLRGDPVVVRDGTEVSPSELRDGTAVEVWTADACAESYPVQCDVEAIRVLD
jgi:hypothetical protein